MSNYWIEIRSSVRRQGAPRLVPLADVGKYSGFRSVFAYDDTVADLIRANRSTYGLRDAPVYADTLLVDFDRSDGTSLRTYLDTNGIGYECWDSGNRSVHLHIPISPIYGAWVPAALRDWVQERAPDADLTFYHQSGQYRLPHTFHAKNPGHCKTRLYEQAGSLLVIEQPPPKIRAFTMHDEDTDKAGKFFVLLLAKQGKGGRNQYVWRLAMTGAEAGMGFDETLEHLVWWRDRMCYPPLADHELVAQCKSAYRRVSR